MKAWHFVSEVKNGCAVLRDGTLAKVGKKLRYEGFYNEAIRSRQD